MPAALLAPQAVQPRVAAVHMQQLQLDDESKAFYEGYVETDPVTGESKALSLDEKEKLYLECLDAYYNEDGKQLLNDEEYEKLKLDLDFDGSRVATFSADEIKFVIANKRFKMGKPVLNDVEYDALRLKLKGLGSPVIIHEGAKCSVDEGICKSDLSIDTGKTRLLYIPGVVGGSILFTELSFWTLHTDPIIGIVLGAIPAYFFGIWFTENVFAQNPIVTQCSCPNCGTLNTIFFGDLFGVMTDGLAGPPAPGFANKATVELKCSNCKSDLTANRDEMIVTTTLAKV